MFRDEVNALVSLIPSGRLMTYGQIASLAGNPQAARIVGGIAHFGDPSIPWQRVVSKNGHLAKGYPGGIKAHKAALENEGVEVSEGFRVDIKGLIWWPIQENNTAVQ